MQRRWVVSWMSSFVLVLGNGTVYQREDLLREARKKPHRV